MTNQPPGAEGTPQEKVSSTKRAREDLKLLFKRYYELLGFFVKEHDGLVEVFETGASTPVFKYVFDRKSQAKNSNASLITFNNPELESIIETIKEKGKIAKAFIPFEFKPDTAFSEGLKKLVSKSNEKGNFVKNGDVRLESYHIGYVPFLIFIARIDFSSIEAVTSIERAIIPLIDIDEETKQVKELITFYTKRLDSYFQSEQPRLTNDMPVQGELLEITDEKIKTLVDKAIPKLNEAIKTRTTEVDGRLRSRLQKELTILDTYYKQLLTENETATDAARQKKDTTKIPDLEQERKNIEKEWNFKKSEYSAMYKLDTNFEVLGVAAIYIPIIFQFKCKIASNHGDIEYTFDYNIFDQELIPPTCACGLPIYQGQVCSNKHLSCLACVGICHECGKDVCSACNTRECVDCRRLFCQNHYYECTSCARRVELDASLPRRCACKAHIKHCAICGKMLCSQCVAVCSVCNRTVCFDCGIFSCKDCKKIVCIDHVIECPRCVEKGVHERSTCKEDSKRCDFCGKIFCSRCVQTCKECGKTVCETCGIYKCKVCGKTLCKDHAIECHQCSKDKQERRWVCKDHSWKCDFCGESFCTQTCKQVMCSVCNKLACEACGAHACKSCGKGLCKDHAVECRICKEEKKKNCWVCPTHAVTCHFCNEILCDGHAPACNICGNHSCDNCGHYLCKTCKKNLCRDDVHECDRCKALGKKNPVSCPADTVKCDICGKSFCLACEPAIAICDTCGKKICKDCKPSKCKHRGCKKAFCQEHHHECEIHKRNGADVYDVCTMHSEKCNNCNKIVCFEHSVKCTVCSKYYCTDDTCSIVSEKLRLNVCKEHSFLSPYDDNRHSIADRVYCLSCHLFYTISQMDLKHPGMCIPCTTASEENFYLFLRRMEFQFVYPSILNINSDNNITTVNLEGKVYEVPANQAHVRMTELKSLYFVLFNIGTDGYTLVHYKNTNAEILYRNPTIIGKIKDFFSRNDKPTEISLVKPAFQPIMSALSKKPDIPATILPSSSIQVSRDSASDAVAASPPNTTPIQRPVSTDNSRAITIISKTKKLFAASTRIKLDMLRRVLEMDQGNFSLNIVKRSAENGLVIEGDYVIVGTSDNAKFFLYLESILLKDSGSFQ